MAVASEGFSIREYASKMRSIDVFKCWPFSTETERETIEAFLPPISVQKFKWWADEVEIKEDEVFGLICPVCSLFKAPTVMAMNAHVHTCLAHSSRKKEQLVRIKAKSRVPKKRSIVEIFAVAPQVEKLYDDDDDDDDNEDDHLSTQEDDEFHDFKLSTLVDAGLFNKRRRKLKLKHGAITNKLNNLKKKKKKMKKKKKRNRAAVDLSIPSIQKKEKSQNLKQKSQVSSTAKCNSSPHTVGLAKAISDAIPVHKKKSRPISSIKEKKKKYRGSCKLTPEKNKSVLSVRGILKNQSKVGSRQTSTLGTMGKSNEADWCCIQQSGRHVRFSEMDDILGPRKKSFAPLECQTLPRKFCCSHAGAASLEMDHSEERGNKFVVAEVNGSKKNDSTSKENENGVQSVTAKQSSDMCVCVGKPNFMRPCISQEHLKNMPVPVNQVEQCSENLHVIDRGCRLVSHDPLSACPPGYRSPEDGFIPDLITQVGEDMPIASATKGKVIAHHRDPSPRLAAFCSRDYVNTFSQPSASYFTSANGNTYARFPILPETPSQNHNGQNLQYHPFRHLSPKELMRSICSLPDLKQRSAMREERSVNEDFFGLPLNSQGELIQLNSSGNSGFNQLIRPSTVTDSPRTLVVLNSKLPSSPGDHLSFKNCNGGLLSESPFTFFPIQNNVKEKPNFLVSSSLGITELQSTGRSDAHFLNYLRGNNHSVYPLESGLDLMNIPNHRNKHHHQIWNHSGNRYVHQERNPNPMPLDVSQPTMRLMGKEFPVGRNYKNLQGPEDEKVWMDKQIIVEHRLPADIDVKKSVSSHFQPEFIIQPSAGKGKEIAHSSDIQINQESRSILQMKPLEPRFSQPHLSCQTNTVYENGCRAINGASFTRSHPYYHPDGSPAFFNREPIFQEPFVREYESLQANPRSTPIQASSPQNTSQNLSSNYNQSNNRQNLPYSTSSTFKFPFLRPDLGERVGPTYCQGSFKSLPPWLLNATRQKETLIDSFQSFSEVGGSRHPSTMSGSNFQKIPSVCRTPDASYGYRPLSTQSPLQYSTGMTSLSQSPLAPPNRGILPNSIINSRREYRMKFKERMKARLCVKNPAHGKRIKKRPAAKSEYSMKPTKIPHLEISNDSSCPVIALKASSDYGGDMRSSRGIPGLNLAKHIEKMSLEGGQNTNLTMDDKQDAVERPAGPVKLAAGAKHILKPSDNTSESTSRLTHLKIPFAAVTSSGLVSESQKKSAEIYRF